jgi:hypothetical protein
MWNEEFQILVYKICTENPRLGVGGYWGNWVRVAMNQLLAAASRWIEDYTEGRIKFVPKFPPSIFMETTILSWFIVNGFIDVYIFLSTKFISVNGFINFYIFESTSFILMIGGVLSSMGEPMDFLTVHIQFLNVAKNKK